MPFYLFRSFIYYYYYFLKVFLSSLVGKESACNAGDLGLILGSEDHLEKKMATHSSTLAWRIPKREELGGL